MKLHILAAVALATAAAGDARSADQKPWRLGGAPASVATAEALARLNAVASRPFALLPSGATRAALSVAGGALATHDPDHVAAARRFFADHGALFALDPALALEVARPFGVQPRRVTFDLLLDGVPVDGAHAIAAFDADDAITSAAVGAPPSTVTLGAFVLSADQARAAGAAAMRLGRARVGRRVAEDFWAPIARKTWSRTPSGLVPTWSTDHFSVSRSEAWRVALDARSGATLAFVDLVQRGTGFFPTSANPMTGSISVAQFNTANGTGPAYANNAAAIAGNATQQTFFDLASPPPTNFWGYQTGDLAGARVHVLTYSADSPSGGATLAFAALDPHTNPGADRFDQTNIYFVLETYYRHLRTTLGGAELASNFSIPVEVNFQPSPAAVNAFFSPDPYPNPNSPYTLGFMQFFDLQNASVGGTPCGLEFDLARDAVAGCHEYTHGWLHYENLEFFGQSEFPARAINEAAADAFATAFHDETHVGSYLASLPAGALLFPDGGLRNLQGDAHYPETTNESLFDVNQGTGTPLFLPEEHENSVTFSSMTVDWRNHIGNSKLEQLLFAALPGMPHTELDVGFSDNDVVNNPFAATDVFFGNCAAALLGVLENNSQYESFLGATTERGILGSIDPTDGTLFNNLFILSNLELVSNRKLVIPSSFPRDNVGQVYWFQARKNRTLKVTVAADQSGDLLPDFTVFTFNGGDPSKLKAKQKHFTDGGKTVKQKFTLKLKLNAQSGFDDPYYGIAIAPISGSGAFTLTLDA